MEISGQSKEFYGIIGCGSSGRTEQCGRNGPTSIFGCKRIGIEWSFLRFFWSSYRKFLGKESVGAPNEDIRVFYPLYQCEQTQKTSPATIASVFGTASHSACE